MPELPEVETTRRGIASALIGRRVTDVIVRDRRIERRAKYILIVFDTGTLILHLGMSGSLRIVAGDLPPRVHDHWDVHVDSGQALRFLDPRRFGSAHWTELDPLELKLLSKLAPEPLSEEFDAEHLFRATRKRTVAIKQLIMNSHVVVGVGNIYASEALFRAGISPRRAARRITWAQASALIRAIKDVLAEAIEIGGTTLRDYVNAQGVPGYFRQKLFVYERGGHPCRVCKTPVKQFVQGSRSTYWCAICQR